MGEQGETFVWEVAGTEAGMRVDKFVAERGDWSRTLVQSWIESGALTVEDRIVKANHRLQAGDRVSLVVPPAEELEVKPEPLPLGVVYEDQDVIVVNKPRGMVVHPAPGHFSGTLVNALLAHCHDLSGINGVLRPGIVHRIDKGTSGLIVAAKNDVAHECLAKQLSQHSMKRVYLAIVHGKLLHREGTIDAPIGRHPTKRKEMAVVHKNGKRAVTHFVVRETFTNYSVVECKLETGRTHQIRVHMAYIGHPVVGDPTYGPKKSPFTIAGQALHAETLGFLHPRTKEPMEFHAPLPEDMNAIVRQLKMNS